MKYFVKVSIEKYDVIEVEASNPYEATQLALKDLPKDHHEWVVDDIWHTNNVGGK